MSRGTKLTILIIAGVIVIGLIVYFFIIPAFKAVAPATNSNANNNLNSSLPNTNSQPAINKPVAPPPSETTEESKVSSAARTVALAFAERFATYSNRNDLANLNDLEAISTPAVWKFIQGGYRDELKKSMPAGDEYYAMTSTALNANITIVSDTELSAKVPMQRVESGSVEKTTYATLDLKLKKVNDAWLVSWEEWEK